MYRLVSSPHFNLYEKFKPDLQYRQQHYGLMIYFHGVLKHSQNQIKNLGKYAYFYKVN